MKYTIPEFPYTFIPLTQEYWDDFVKLFGNNGACGGCWCMVWRSTYSEFQKNKGDKNKSAMQKIVESNEIPGILAFENDIPIGWCSVAARDQFSFLDRSRILKKVDEKPVWSVSCFFIDKKYRGKGIAYALLEASKLYVKDRGGNIIEGYPVDAKTGKMADAFAWVGLAQTFIKAGFSECIRRSGTRPVMRFLINK